jgi:replicative DNA helicase
MHHNGEHVDAISVDAALSRAGISDDVGGFAYLMDLCKVANVSNYVAHAKIVRESAISRVINAKLNDAIAMVNENDGRTVYEKVGDLESMISAVLDRSIKNDTSGLVHASDICDRWSKELEDRFENPEAQSGYSTGIKDLDKILNPKLIRKGSLVVVGARPKMGKTALLGSLTKQFALEHKKATAVFSLEMPSDQIMERMLCERANVNGNIFYQGSDNDSDFARVSAAMGEYVNSKLYMDDTPAITIQHIQRESRKLSKIDDVGLIAVDYLTLMEAEKADRNDLAYGKITKALKNLAKELNCVVLLLTQLNRSLESRPNKRPMPSDSRDTGQIEQDCDLWIGLYRHAVYDDNVIQEEKGLTEVIVRLNRHGDTGTAYLNLKNGYFVEGHKPTISQGIVDDEY